MNAGDMMAGFVLGIIACLLMTMCSSCTTTKYVPIEHHTIDTLRITKYERDSIYVHDSTFVKVDGDTVLIEKWHTSWRDRWQHDTIYQSKTDSIPYPVEVTKEVPAQLTWWQQARMHVGGIVIYGLLIVLFIYIFKFYRKYAKP
jgi:hypothetical protein